MKQKILFSLFLIQCLITHAGPCPDALTTVNWDGIAITNNVIDENIVISGNNTFAKSITVTAKTKNITITIAGADTTINGSNYSLSLYPNNGCAITIQFENNTLILSNIIVHAKPRVDLVFNNGIDGKLLLMSNARWLWK